MSLPIFEDVLPEHTPTIIPAQWQYVAAERDAFARENRLLHAQREMLERRVADLETELLATDLARLVSAEEAWRE